MTLFKLIDINEADLEFDGVPDIGGRLVPTLQCAIDDYLTPECRIVLIPLEQVATIKSLLLDYDYMNLPPGDLDISNWIGNLAKTFNPQPEAKKIEILAAQMDRFGHDIPGWLYHPELVAVAAQAFACLPSSKQLHDFLLECGYPIFDRVRALRALLIKHEVKRNGLIDWRLQQEVIAA